MPVNIAVLTRVRSLAMLVTHSLPNSLTPVSKVDLCEPGMWRWQLKTCWSLLTDLIDVPTQNLLRLALLLMLMMKIVLATVCCILGSWGLVIKPNFCSDFQHKVSSRFWSWSSGRILKLEFGQYFAADVLQRLWRWILVKMLKQGLVNILNFKFSRGGDVWCGFWSECLVEILKMKFDQDLCLNLWYDPTGYFGKLNSTLRSVVPLAMFIFLTLLRTILHLITYY